MRADYAAFAKANGVLDMPPGYTADAQINRYAFEQTGKPRLIRLGTWIGGILIAILGLLWWRRLQRRRT